MGTLRAMPRPATGKTPVRNFRISDAVYGPARRIADARKESLTDVVERALLAYAKRHKTDDPGPSDEDS